MVAGAAQSACGDFDPAIKAQITVASERVLGTVKDVAPN
jgi:hypothetical protein